MLIDISMDMMKSNLVFAAGHNDNNDNACLFSLEAVKRSGAHKAGLVLVN